MHKHKNNNALNIVEDANIIIKNSNFCVYNLKFQKCVLHDNIYYCS